MSVNIEFSCRCGAQDVSNTKKDEGRVVVEYLNATKTVVLYSYVSDWWGEFNTGSHQWHLFSDTHRPPIGTRYVRVTLHGRKNVGTVLNVYFDAVTCKVNSTDSGLSGELIVNGDFEIASTESGGRITLTGWGNAKLGGYPSSILDSGSSSPKTVNGTSYGGFSAYEGSNFLRMGADASGRSISQKDDIDLTFWADEIDLVEEVIPDNPFRLFTHYPHSFNAVLNSSIIINDKTADADAINIYTNLLNPLGTRKVIFNSNTSAYIVYDLTSLPADKRKITDVIIYKHNLALNGQFIISASDVDDDWGAAPFTLTQDVVEDRDTDPDALINVDYPSGLMHTLTSVKTTHIKLGQDIGVYDFIKIEAKVESPVNPENISITKLHVGSKYQTTINYEDGWSQEFIDNSHSVEINSGTNIFIDKYLKQQFKFKFEYMSRADARLARAAIYDDGNTCCFISADYDNTNDWDEIRKHTLTLYGQLDLSDIVEKRMYNIHAFEITFLTDTI